MSHHLKVALLVIVPPLLWSVPSVSIFLESTHYWPSLLIAFMGFYPGPTSGVIGFWRHLALNNTLMTAWGCLMLLGYAALASYALRRSSKPLGLTCAILITLSTLAIFMRINLLGY